MSLKIGKRKWKRGGFSLIELVIVVVIIAIIGAIAIPRISRGAAGASDSALVGDLAVLRNAIDLYATEHNGTFPSAANFEAQMTEFTDSAGTPSPTKTTSAIYGPYLRRIPPLPLGANKNANTVADGTSGSAGATADGWFYNPTTGQIVPNTGDSEYDTTGKAYNLY